MHLECNVDGNEIQSRRALTFSSDVIATTAFSDPPFSSWAGTPAPRVIISYGGRWTASTNVFANALLYTRAKFESWLTLN